TVDERILARLIQIETVIGVLERGRFDSARDQARNQLGNTRGFAQAAPTGETDNSHGPLIAKRPAVKPGVLRKGSTWLFVGLGSRTFRAAGHLLFKPQAVGFFPPIAVPRRPAHPLESPFHAC